MPRSNFSTTPSASTTPTCRPLCDPSPPSRRKPSSPMATSRPRNGGPTERGLTADDDLTYVREYEHITLARVLLAKHATDRDDRPVDARSDCWTASSPRPSRASAPGAPSRSSSRCRSRTRPAATTRRRPPRSKQALDPGRDRRATSASSSTTSPRSHRYCARSHRTAPPAPTPDECSRPHRQPTASPSAGTARQALVDELSSRELDVLRLLRSDLSGPDIARELVVSLNTVRTHTKNIYIKLGVNNRREAVAPRRRTRPLAQTDHSSPRMPHHITGVRLHHMWG